MLEVFTAVLPSCLIKMHPVAWQRYLGWQTSSSMCTSAGQSCCWHQLSNKGAVSEPPWGRLIGCQDRAWCCGLQSQTCQFVHVGAAAEAVQRVQGAGHH